MMFLKSLPNRYSYFLKKETNLYDWFISSIIYKNSKEVALKQIENALGILISENDSLRIRFSFENGELNEFIEESFIVNNYFDVNYIDGIEIKDVKENFEKRVEAYKREMQEYSELFKLFVLIDGRGGMYLYFLIHHLTCDLRSYIIIKNRFFELIDSQTIVDKVLYNKYVENIFNYWGKEKNFKDNIYDFWIKYYSEKFDSLGVFDKGCLLEKYSENIEIKISGDLNDSINRLNSRDLPILILLSYSNALNIWSNGRCIKKQICLVHHGREYFDNEISGANLVGWLSQIFPFSLNNNLPVNTLIKNIREQLYFMYAYSSSYGFMKYVNKNPLLVNIPEPEISINIVLDNSRNGDFFNFKSTGFNVFNKMNPNSKRAFILSSGFYRNKGDFYFSIDYSNKIYDKESIMLLISAFEKEFSNLLCKYYV